LGGPPDRIVPDRIVVGRIVKPHGVLGEVVVQVLTDVRERFARGARLEAGDPAGGPGVERRTLTVRSTRDDRGRLLVRFAQVSDRTAADALRGALLSIGGAEAARPPDGAYYAWQLEGLDVVDEAGAPLGRLAHVLAGAASDLWVVDTGSAEVMVPAVPEFVRRVDLEGGRIVMHVIPGLFP
jgi:16S rRNA processing protein RimM